MVVGTAKAITILNASVAAGKVGWQKSHVILDSYCQ